MKFQPKRKHQKELQKLFRHSIFDSFLLSSIHKLSKSYRKSVFHINQEKGSSSNSRKLQYLIFVLSRIQLADISIGWNEQCNELLKERKKEQKKLRNVRSHFIWNFQCENEISGFHELNTINNVRAVNEATKKPRKKLSRNGVCTKSHRKSAEKWNDRKRKMNNESDWSHPKCVVDSTQFI